MDQKINLFIDMDDTLCNTRGWLETFSSMLGYSKFTPEIYHLEKVDVPERIINFALSEARFMLDASPLDLMIPALTILSRRANLHICTHRGYHTHGFIYTKEWLQAHKVYNFFESIQCIDPMEWPCKLEYLDTISGLPYRLLDDRPHNLESAKGKAVIYSRPWNSKLEGDRVSSLVGMVNILDEMKCV